jgi:hydrogenase nickel incorporation protein HypA/HybF
MHEYSVVQALMEKIETLAKENDATSISKVIVKIGVMSGIEPHLLELAFETFKERTICHKAEFIMDIQAVTILCHSCQLPSELENNHYICPACKSPDLEVTDGEDMILMRLEMNSVT